MSEDTVNLGSAPETPVKKEKRARTVPSVRASKSSPVIEYGDDAADANVTSSSKFPKVRVVFNESNLPDDLPEILLGVNGRMYQVLRGVEVALPPEAIEAADHSVIDQVRQHKDGTLYTVPTKRFPYQILDAEGHATMESWRRFHDDRRLAA